MKTRKISLDDWHSYSLKGVDVPLTIQVHGHSMEPMIRFEKDWLTIVPLKREPLVGDVVLFRRADGAYVVHRVYRVTPESIQTWGDNCPSPDAPLSRRSVLGLAVSLRRNGRLYRIDSDRQRNYGARWMKFYRKPWIFCRKIKSKLA